PHGAGDVLEPTALAADQVVVVVVAVDLVLHAAPAHGDPAYELDVGQRIEHVVDGLAGHGAQTLTDIVGDGLRIGVRMRLDRRQRRESRRGHAQARGPEGGGVVGGCHAPTVTPSLDMIKKASWPREYRCRSSPSGQSARNAAPGSWVANLPPLTSSSAPVMSSARSLARNRHRFATSCGSPQRRTLSWSSLVEATASSRAAKPFIAVGIIPGAEAFTVIPQGPSSHASTRVSCTTAAVAPP